MFYFYYPKGVSSGKTVGFFKILLAGYYNNISNAQVLRLFWGYDL
ncbi:MAG: hypothetical protein OT643_01650 [Bacteroidetes bacterium]|nr:hypothetical protein [Bacteroidota bacterium]HMS52795.1 hypothetical protein [Chitinophagales bacterium]